MKKSDLILEVERAKFRDLESIFAILKKQNNLDLVEKIVVRNQSELTLSIKVN